MEFLFRQIKQKPIEYAILFLIFISSLLCFFLFGADFHNRRRIIYATTIAYLAWSIYHHYRRGDLALSIVIEYLVFALFALVLISTTLF